MAAVTAAVATTAIAAGTAAYSASQKKKAAKEQGKAADQLAAGGTQEPPSLRERLFNRGSQDILDEERAVLEDATSQGKLIEPELYRMLGLEPIYEGGGGPGSAELEGKSAALAGKQDQLSRLREQHAALKTSGLKGQKRERARARIERQQAQVNKEISVLQGEVGRASVGRKVVGFKRLEGIADPTGSTGGAFGSALDQFNSHLGAALAGEEPLDPTLARTFDERERTLRERLRRQMGPDYETSTAGAEALANFDREKAEAFAQYNRESIGLFAQLGENRAGALSDLTTRKLANLQGVPAFRAGLGKALGGAATDRQGLAELRQRERISAAEQEGANQRAAADLRSKAATGEAAANAELVSGIGGAVGGGLGGAGGTLARYLGSYSARGGTGTFTGEELAASRR